MHFFPYGVKSRKLRPTFPPAVWREESLERVVRLLDNLFILCILIAFVKEINRGIRMSLSSPIPFRFLSVPLLTFIAAYFVENWFTFASSFLFAVGIAHLCHSLYRSFKVQL